MKSIFTFLTVLFLFSACQKDALQFNEETISCDQTAEGIVKKELLSENGSEYFYYVELHNNTLGKVFPSGLQDKFKEEGMRIKVSFKKLSQSYTYVRCEDIQHVGTEQSQAQEMPMVNVCSAAPTS